MKRRIDLLTVEVGSTITKANGFRLLAGGGFSHEAQGFAKTSVDRNDVGIGMAEAREDLERNSGIKLEDPETFVNSSAAGGLRMTVHGLTYNMTARAAKEASLGAGAIVKMITAGSLGQSDLDEIRDISPNIILLAGGVDFGEKKIVLANAEKLTSLNMKIPVLYAGNCALHKTVRKIFHSAGMEIIIVDNVFPAVDVLNVEPLRRAVHEIFSRTITHAPGMERFEGLSHWGILPTPGAVLKGAELFSEAVGDCLVLDVGGATTDIHSVTDGTPEYQMNLLEPEPRAKRTVEGDLGVYVNARNILQMSDNPEGEAWIRDLAAMPKSETEKELTKWLCARAVETGVKRHAGRVDDLFTATGKKKIVKGKDLTAVKWIVATGGALTRIDGGADCLKAICTGPGKYLLPREETKILMDKDYLFSALGTAAQAYPSDVKLTFTRWVEEKLKERSHDEV